MFKLLKELLNVGIKPDLWTVDRAVDYSLSKYRKTYELLEEYDRKNLRDPEELADSGRLRPDIRELQAISGI